ncbi:MAG: BMP family ABC transporter substrate-binding protein [Clostridiales bacterium]|nr:BMP family ABC transporter substrate-binding protein [Clostridiales bacterium]
MKKLLTFALAAILAVGCCFGIVSCGNTSSGDTEKPYNGIVKVENLADIKVGLICLHGESSTYDKNFIDAFNAACTAKGVKSVTKVDIPESSACYDAAADLVDQGCNIIFADSFGHEEHMLKAAKEFPEVQFCHATGTYAHTEKRGNFHNAFASIYEGRYLAGIAGGMKLKEMIENNQLKPENYDANGNVKVGYVGAWTYAEVISGFTSWFLGVRSIVPNVVMDVQFTGSWYDETAEKTAAELLINEKHCALISQHADSMGAPTACETAGVPNVSYNGSTATACPKTFVASSRINWQPYFEYIIDCVNKGEEISVDYCAGIGSTWSNGSVALTDLGTAAATGTQEAIDAAIAELKAGTLKVFDLSKFKVDGNALADDFKADVDTDAQFTADTVVIKTAGDIKYFAESEFRSAPYFGLKIDGITYLNEKY